MSDWQPRDADRGCADHERIAERPLHRLLARLLASGHHDRAVHARVLWRPAMPPREPVCGSSAESRLRRLSAVLHTGHGFKEGSQMKYALAAFAALALVFITAAAASKPPTHN